MATVQGVWAAIHSADTSYEEVNNLDNVVENTTAAESQIRDTDMATEMESVLNHKVYQSISKYIKVYLVKRSISKYIRSMKVYLNTLVGENNISSKEKAKKQK